MTFYLLGVDHKTMPFAAREDFYKQRKPIVAFLAERISPQAVMFVTCNRMEIYAVAGDLSAALRQGDLLQKQFPAFSVHGYSAFGERAVFQHVVRLASGLESQLKGERQILQQLEAWKGQDAFPLALADLVQKAMSCGQEISHKAGLNLPEHNIADVVFEEFLRQTKGAKERSVLILGTGKVAELFSDLQPEDALFYFASSRNFSKAEILAQYAGGKAIRRQEIPTVIKNVDAVIGATVSPHLVFRASDAKESLAGRQKPLYVYDLAFPRDIDPAVGELPHIILKNLDDLHLLFEEYNSRIQAQINRAEYFSAFVGGHRVKSHGAPCAEEIKTQPENIYV